MSKGNIEDILQGMSKVMLSLPDKLLNELDAAARALSMSRSALVREAIRLYMAQGPPPRREAAIQRLRRTFRSLPGTPEDLVRAERAR